ncbi:MAG: dihydroxyacetone kinase subunit L [Propionibacteriaceae bacterium]|jgi:dihydroxyacetone kinase phosphoprotein-dependent L subunit|nr:dihydroxyacetone kinase subunit L [Propionibacteriaceae bacterium]
MSGSITDVEFVMRNLAENIVANEKYFGELDAVVGDGDFGYSLARGFEIVLDQWDDFDRSDPGVFLTKIAAATSARIGGTSGPIWGTAMLRAGVQLKEHPDIEGADVVRALRASIEGIKTRGQADVGDKTLLDSLVPAVDTLEAGLAAGKPPKEIVAAMAATAEEAAENTKTMQAMRGRAAYTGERSIGSVDAGAKGVAVLLAALAEAWPET